MTHIRYIATTLALSALATGSAWAASGADPGVNPRGNDRDISRQLANDLIRQVAVGPYGVRVRTQNGIVRLSGSVGSVIDWKKADAEARGTDGVVAVQNDLSVLIR